MILTPSTLNIHDLVFAASGTDLRMVSTALAMLGRLGMAGCFSIIFLFSCELYPTVIRNVCMGACAFWARVGGILAPQLIFLVCAF